MSDRLTTPRQLHQIHWERGITDGDIRPGFMSKLLNVEMDEGGRIRCRDGVVTHDIHIPTVNPSKFIHINGDPSALFNGGWNIFLTETEAFVYPYGYDMTEPESANPLLPFPIDLNSIEVVIVGTNVIVSSLNSETGEPNPIISIVWNPDTPRFSPPQYIEESDDLYGQTELEGGWGIHSFDRVPKLVVEFTTPETSDLKNIRRQLLSNLERDISIDPENTIGLFITHREKDTISIDAPGYLDRAVVNIVAVFVYADGSSSLPSNEISISMDLGDDEAYFDLCITPFVHSSCFKSVVGIKFYRKISEGVVGASDNYDYLMYAPLHDDDIHEDTKKVSALTDGNRNLTKVPNYGVLFSPEEACDNYRHHKHENDYGLAVYEYDGSWKFVGQDSLNLQDRVSYSHDFGIGATHYRTAGWIKPNLYSEIMMYMPEHFYQYGQMFSRIGVKHHYADGTGGRWGMMVNIYHAGGTLKITDRINKGADTSNLIRPNSFEFIENAVVIGSHPSPNVRLEMDNNVVSGPSYRYVFPDTNLEGDTRLESYDKDTIAYRGLFRLSNCNQWLSYYTLNVPSEWDVDSFDVGDVPTDGNDGFEKTFIAWRDKGKAQFLPSLEEEYGGVHATDIATVKPRHIGAAGGRLFALNIVEDDEENTSKMMYSEIGNYVTFRKDNYIDYGVRDDGYGVAISTLKSYVIAHHSASTYIFDIAGGSDFTWREVSAFKDVGCLHDDLTVTTPFGVFWCDKKHLWYYAGGEAIPITKEIQTTYRAMVPTLKRLLYKQDLKQLWLMQNNNDVIYIFDIEGNRWHTHDITEFGINISMLAGIFDVSGFMFCDVSNYNNGNHAFYKFTEESLSPFNWEIYTGNMDFGSPEIVKKIRRLYTHLVRYEAYRDESKNIRIRAIGSTSGDIDITDNFVINDEQIRVSTSVRGYHISFRLTVESSWFWRGKLESLGVSFKPKKLK